MKQFQKIFFLMAILPLLFVASCKDDDPAPATDNFTVLSDYLVANDMDLGDILGSWITARPVNEDGSAKTDEEVDTWLSGFHVFDIRAAEDYGSGHVNFAINSSLGTIVADAASVTKPILVVCYSGQTAAHAVVALKLSGHPDAKTLKWGMSGWNSNNSAPWEANSGPVNGVIGVGNTNWVTVATPNLDDFDLPTFTTTSTDPAAMLAERVTFMTSGGFKGVAAADVLASPGSYFINNFWDLVDVEHYGHINGSYRVKPLTLEGDQFKHNDASKTVVTYCWTGQTSSMVTAYLTVMGYDAKSLKYGTNSMIYSELGSHKFVTPGFNYSVVQ